MVNTLDTRTWAWNWWNEKGYTDRQI